MSLRWLTFALLGIGLAALSPVCGFGAESEQIQSDSELLRSVALGTDGASLLAYFKKRTVSEVDREHIGKLIHDLASEDFDTRETASTALMTVGPSAREQLKEAVKSSDIEVARRATLCLQQIDHLASPEILSAAVRLLAHHKPEGATESVLAFLPQADHDIVIEEAISTLKVVGFKNGKPRPVLLQAVSDKSGPRRAAAAQALCQGGTKEDRQTVLPLLGDADVKVRQSVALALLDAKEKAAIPVLIDLLAQVPQDKVWSIEAALEYLAGDKAPLGNLSDEAARKHYRDAWAAWWKENGKSVDLAKIDQTQRQLGFTLATLLDASGATGHVAELDPNGKVRWQIGNLRYPCDAQLLPGGERVLIAEYTNRAVTERNLKGEVLWTKTVNGPVIGARRLANGNTFIVSRTQLLEVNKDGKEVVTINRNDIAAAVKLRDGQIGLITNVGKYVRLNAEGKEQQSFNVGTIYPIGGHFEVLANGHVLVPLYTANKVVEYDQNGKEVWSANSQRPTCVTRLPRGNTLISSRYASLITELDRSGKEVSKITAEGRVMQIGRR